MRKRKIENASGAPAGPADSSHADGGTDELATAEAFITANLYAPVTASDIAAAAGLKPRSLHRLFRKNRAMTPMQFLLNLRIAAAREMILRGNASSVRQVAARLQFSNPSHFSKLYRKIYDQVPSREINGVRDGFSRNQ